MLTENLLTSYIKRHILITQEALRSGLQTLREIREIREIKATRARKVKMVLPDEAL